MLSVVVFASASLWAARPRKACLAAGQSRQQNEAGVVFVCITYLIKVFNE
jgi:hypothetical protein